MHYSVTLTIAKYPIFYPLPYWKSFYLFCNSLFLSDQKLTTCFRHQEISRHVDPPGALQPESAPPTYPMPLDNEHLSNFPASPEGPPEGLSFMRNVREAMRPVCSFHNVHFHEYLYKHELTHAESLLNSAYLVLSSDPPYHVQSGREDANFHYDILTSESLADSVALCNSVMRSKSTTIYSVSRYPLLSDTGCCQQQWKGWRATAITLRAVQQRTVNENKKAYFEAGGFRYTTLENRRAWWAKLSVPGLITLAFPQSLCNFGVKDHHLKMC